MSPPPCNGTTFFRWCLLGAFFFQFFKRKLKFLAVRYGNVSPDPSARRRRPQFYVQFDLNFTSNSTSIIRPIRPQLYVQFDLNYTSNSISIIHPIRSQLYLQFDVNFTSNATSILRPDRNQWDNFFLPTVRSLGDMKLPLPTILYDHSYNVQQLFLSSYPRVVWDYPGLAHLVHLALFLCLFWKEC